jgi:hypothetical protein
MDRKMPKPVPNNVKVAGIKMPHPTKRKTAKAPVKAAKSTTPAPASKGNALEAEPMPEE